VIGVRAGRMRAKRGARTAIFGPAQKGGYVSVEIRGLIRPAGPDQAHVLIEELPCRVKPLPDHARSV
jgi:hypothetical protein